MRIVLLVFFSFVVSIIASLGGNGAAYAQDRIPSITVPKTPMQSGASRPTIFKLHQTPNFSFDNPYMNDALQLQYQISLLQRMIQRQSTLARLEKSYIELGSFFTPPAPPRGICEQIPANVPCNNAYPDLYNITLAEVEQIDVDDIEEVLQPIMPVVPVQPIQPVSVPESKSVDYSWAEVSCAGGRCSAVLVKGDRSSARETVRLGDVLDDNIQVTEISSRGVVVDYDGEAIMLAPAPSPSRGGTASPLFGGMSMDKDKNSRPELSGDDFTRARQIADLFTGDNASAPPPPQQTGTAEVSVQSLPEEPIEDPGPPLGPTGLF